MEKKVKICPDCKRPVEFEGNFCGLCGAHWDDNNGDGDGDPVELKLKQEKVGAKKFFFGRSPELNMIPDLAKGVLNSRGQVVYLEGPAGIGKTAFVNQLIPFFLKNEFSVQRISGVQEFGLLTFFPFQQLVARVVGIDEQAQRNHIAKSMVKLRSIGLSDIEVFYLSHLFPVDIPRTSNRFLDDNVRLAGLSAAIVHLIQILSKQQPLLLILDHLQWADPFTRRLIKALESVVGFERIMLIVAGRDQQAEEDTSKHVHVLRFSGLGVGDIIAIARMYLKVNSLPGEIEEQLHEVTGGNPLAAFFFVDFLLEKSYLIQQGENWRINGKLRGLKFPSGLQEIVQARLELLKPHMQELMWLIAVAADECQGTLLKTLYSYPDYLRQDLEELGAKRFIRISSLGDVKRISYTHNYIQEFIYKKIPGSGLLNFHPKVGNYLQTNESLFSYMKNWLCVFHFSFQHEHSEQMVYYMERAGDSLARQLHFFMAAHCYRRVVQHLKEIAKSGKQSISMCESKQAILKLKLARCFVAIGDRQRADKAFDEAFDLAVHRKLPMLSVGVLLEQGDFHLRSGDTDKASRCYEKGLDFAHDSGDRFGLSTLMLKLGEVHHKKGDFDQAKLRLEKSERYCREMEPDVEPTRRWLGKVMHARGHLLLDEKEYGGALGMLVEAMDRGNESHDVPLLIRVTERMAAVYARQEKYDRALGFVTLGMQMSREIGDRLSLANLSYQAGRYLILKDDKKEARVAFADTIQICRGINWEQGVEMSRMALETIQGESDVQS